MDGIGDLSALKVDGFNNVIVGLTKANSIKNQFVLATLELSHSKLQVWASGNRFSFILCRTLTHKEGELASFNSASDDFDEFLIFTVL